MKKLFSAGVVLFYKEEKKVWYLLLHYPHGHWDFPKGKIEPKETKEDAALRELKEETGIVGELLPGFSHSFNYFFTEEGHLVQKEVTFFVAQSQEKKPALLSNEHTGYKWLPFGEAYAQLTFENAKKLLIEADEFIGQH